VCAFSWQLLIDKIPTKVNFFSPINGVKGLLAVWNRPGKFISPSAALSFHIGNLVHGGLLVVPEIGIENLQNHCTNKV
jgi:hypothetical protein